MLNMKLEACSGQVLGQMPKNCQSADGLSAQRTRKRASKLETGFEITRAVRNVAVSGLGRQCFGWHYYFSEERNARLFREMSHTFFCERSTRAPQSSSKLHTAEQR